MRSIALWGLALAACTASPSGPIMLVEGYCQNGEADRCYYPQVVDGF